VAGGKVLRLRCYSQAFEFVLPDDVVARSHMMLPPRRAHAAAATPVLAPVLTA
jgi:CRP-like cAMP-binding protein